MACYRMARLAGQGPTLVDQLVGNALDGMAHRGVAAVADDDRLTRAQIDRFREQLRGCISRPRMLESVGPGERFYYLDTICTVVRDGPKGLHVLSLMSDESGLSATARSAAAKPIAAASYAGSPTSYR